ADRLAITEHDVGLEGYFVRFVQEDRFCRNELQPPCRRIFSNESREELLIHLVHVHQETWRTQRTNLVPNRDMTHDQFGKAEDRLVVRIQTRVLDSCERARYQFSGLCL